MDWTIVLTNIASIAAGTVGGRLWSTRIERGQDYERLIRLYREEVERCNKKVVDLIAKQEFYLENIERLEKLADQQQLQINTMEAQITTLEHQIKKQN